LRSNEKNLIGPVILVAILIVAAVSITSLAFAVAQLSQENSNNQIYPTHMGLQWGYGPNQYGPYAGYQGQGWGQHDWGGCPGMNYGYNVPYGEEYSQPGYWNYD
jgi:hypothetical protein